MGTNRTSEQKCTRCANGDSRTPDGFHLKSTGCYVRCADLPPYEPVVARTSKPKSYIQYVPGHCDRIVWRGSYYMLPLPNAPSPVETPQPAAPTANEISDLSPDSKAQAATSNERLPYNERYSKRLTIQLGDLEALQMALGAADDYLRWLELRGQRHGAVEVVERSVRNARALAYQLRSNADETTRDDAAFEAGWRAAAEWAKRDDLVHDIDSPAYRIDRFNRLKRLAVEPTPRHRQPSYVLEQIMNNSTDPWAQGIARTYLMGSPEKAGGKQCDVDGFACDSTERCEECPENGSEATKVTK